MSDDEEVTYTKKRNTIHYGSLEESERSKLEEIHSDEDDFVEPEAKKVIISQPAVANVHTSNEYFELEQEV